MRRAKQSRFARAHCFFAGDRAAMSKRNKKAKPAGGSSGDSKSAKTSAASSSQTIAQANDATAGAGAGAASAAAARAPGNVTAAKSSAAEGKSSNTIESASDSKAGASAAASPPQRSRGFLVSGMTEVCCSCSVLRLHNTPQAGNRVFLLEIDLKRFSAATLDLLTRHIGLWKDNPKLALVLDKTLAESPVRKAWGQRQLESVPSSARCE